MNSQDYASHMGVEPKTVANWCNGGKLKDCAAKTGSAGGGIWLIDVAKANAILNGKNGGPHAT